MMWGLCDRLVVSGDQVCGIKCFVGSPVWSDCSCLVLESVTAVVDPWMFVLLKDKLRCIKNIESLFEQKLILIRQYQTGRG